MTAREIGLADAIEALRSELEDALVRGADKPIQFGLQSIELTLEVAVTWTADAKLGWAIFSAGASRASVGTQTLTLKLDPQLIDPAGKASSFTISGAHDPADTVGGIPSTPDSAR